MTEEIYPMPSFPILIVKDVEASSNFYQSALGFKHIFTMPGPDGQPGLVHLRWVKYADLLITRSRDGKELTEPKGVGISLNFNMFEHFDGDMDAFAKHARENGANVVGPVNQPWNVREVTVFDPDGYKLIFTMPINLNLSFEEVIDRVKTAESQ
ncbi:MAG TPA: VOC family protein [Anaerolineales bacterium]|nr:VOC family protein [Anaerolineales bacterium]